VPFVIVQRSVALVPAATITDVENEPMSVIEAVPLTTLHSPIPDDGLFAFTVNKSTSHCSTTAGPASATVGGVSLVSVMSACVAPHTPLVTVQRITVLVPTGTPVTVVVRAVVLVMVAVPVCTVQTPVPFAGAAAVMLNVPVLH